MLEFLICLLITVSLHELAHMLVALKCGIKVEEFSIGFGKALIQKKFKDINFKLTPILLGGYCKLKGEGSRKEPDDFLNFPYYKKAMVILAGVSANFILASICYLINYGSIKTGIIVDWLLIKSNFGVVSQSLIYYLSVYDPNIFLVQLSILNLAVAVANLIPIVPLDGGMVWYLAVEEKIPEGIKRILLALGLSFIVTSQIVILYYIFFGG